MHSSIGGQTFRSVSLRRSVTDETCLLIASKNYSL